MNHDLERMGDHATNISRGTKMYLSRKEISISKDFLQLIHEVRWMVKNALDAFTNKDPQKAEEVLKRDDTVDKLKSGMMIQMKSIMQQDSTAVDSAVDFILFARNLERVGDLATNIAEDVIFISSGDDIRHRGIASR
jgi:phosphate transport system protein